MWHRIPLLRPRTQHTQNATTITAYRRPMVLIDRGHILGLPSTARPRDRYLWDGRTLRPPEYSGSMSVWCRVTLHDREALPGRSMVRTHPWDLACVGWVGKASRAGREGWSAYDVSAFISASAATRRIAIFG
jgi:hypothetical protein